MRRHVLALLGAALLLSGCVKAPAWREYSSPDGQFSAQLPEPINEQKGGLLPGEKGSGSLVITGGPANNLVFSITSLDGLSELEGPLDRAVALVEKSRGGTATGKEKITIGGHPGIEFKLEGAGGMAYRYRVCAVGRWAYVLHVMALDDKAALDGKDADRFFESFRITG